MTAYFKLTEMSVEELDKELKKARRRAERAKEDISIISSFLKLKSLEAGSGKLEYEKKKNEKPKPENRKNEEPEIHYEDYFDLGISDFSGSSGGDRR